jgi:D-cysteine desulfhydrase
VKRDDLTSPLYGGNKVRKLEHVLAEAKLAGRSRLLTVGGIGSNQCLATALHGKRLGFNVDICLFDQPITGHVKENLLADAKAGAHFVYGGGYVGTALKGISRYFSQSNAYYIPAGATTPLGDVGYVTAALELAEQVKAGVLPEPSRIFVAAGSCGTSAGLIAGLKLAGLRTRVTAVRITDAIVANARHIRGLAQLTLDALREMDPAVPAITVSLDDFDLETGYFGGQYGKITPEGEKAVAAAPGLKLETTYTGKTLAACLDYCKNARPGETVVFWNTFNSAQVEQAGGPEALPPELQFVFREG